MSRARSLFLDELAAIFGGYGLPPMAGRIVAHLLVCDPPQQSFDKLARAVGASRASVSTMTRLLERLGLTERTSGGGKRLSYRLPADVWTRLLDEDLRAATRMRDLAARGVRLAGLRPRAKQRLSGMRAFYTFLERETARSLARWKRGTR